jgi:4-carboxymuconolactone decarboxylase
MTESASSPPNLERLDAATRSLIRLSAAVAAASELLVRSAIEEALRETPAVWVEELLLQSYLFAGFPRALNAMREWRRMSGRNAPRADDDVETETFATWEVRGEVTCATVYGEMYEPLRQNIRALHPALDRWMIVEGYGMVLGRPGLDLVRRELCIVAACVASGQERQLLSHMHGTLNVGGSRAQLVSTLESLEGMGGADELRTARLLLDRVTGKE